MPRRIEPDGLALRAADDVDTIQPFCGSLQGANAVATDVGAPWHGGQGGKVEILTCPAGTPVVIGMDVAAEGVDTVVVNNIHLFCGQVAIPQAPPTYPSAIFDVSGYAPSQGVFGIGASGDAASVRTGSERCPANEVAIGMHGRSGRWVDAIGLVCGAPRLQGSPGARTPVGAIGKVNTGKPSPPGPPMSPLRARARCAYAQFAGRARPGGAMQGKGPCPDYCIRPLGHAACQEIGTGPATVPETPATAPTRAVEGEATP